MDVGDWFAINQQALIVPIGIMVDAEFATGVVFHMYDGVGHDLSPGIVKGIRDRPRREASPSRAEGGLSCFDTGLHEWRTMLLGGGERYWCVKDYSDQSLHSF